MDSKPTSTTFHKTKKYPGDEIPSRPTNEEFYRVNYPSRGLMIIFNHEKFKNSTLGHRNGTEHDLKQLKATFSEIGYTVQDYTDRTLDQVKRILFEASQDDHSNSMSLIIVMLTHGDYDGYLHVQDKRILVEELWKPFTADNCPTLSGKPKLFFLQACKGTLVDPGSFIKEKVLETENFALYSKSCPSPNLPHVIPTLADILIFYSTAEGYPSFRNSTSGSWFIQALCSKFSDYLSSGEEVELMRILTAVSREVAYGYQANMTDRAMEIYHSSKQMPTVLTMLTKILVFNKEN